MSLHIITHVVPYLRSIMHMHFYCYLTGGTAYLLDRESEWCYSGIGKLENISNIIYVQLSVPIISRIYGTLKIQLTQTKYKQTDDQQSYHF